MDDPDVPEDALAAYVRARLELIGPNFAAEVTVQEALTFNRDLWVSLYKIDHGDPSVRLAKPS